MKNNGWIISRGFWDDPFVLYLYRVSLCTFIPNFCCCSLQRFWTYCLSATLCGIHSFVAICRDIHFHYLSCICVARASICCREREFCSCLLCRPICVSNYDTLGATVAHSFSTFWILWCSFAHSGLYGTFAVLGRCWRSSGFDSRGARQAFTFEIKILISFLEYALEALEELDKHLVTIAVAIRVPRRLAKRKWRLRHLKSNFV